MRDAATANENNDKTGEQTPPEPRRFVSLKELRPQPLPEESEEQIRAGMRESVRRNAAALQTLAKL